MGEAWIAHLESRLDNLQGGIEHVRSDMRDADRELGERIAAEQRERSEAIRGLEGRVKRSLGG